MWPRSLTFGFGHRAAWAVDGLGNVDGCGLMKSIAYTYYDKTELTVSGSDKDHVLLIDSLDEAISTKQVSVQSGLFVVLGWWQRVKYIRKVRRENSHCAVYWCRLNSSTGFICVSDLCLAENTATDVEVFVESAKSVKAVHSQLMCIGAALPVAYSSVLLLLKGSIGVRHVYMLAGKPVFTRLLSPSSSIDQLIDSLQATQQHLINRGMLDGLPPILCHGLSKEVVNKLEKAWASARVDSLITVLDPTDKTITKTAASVSLLAVSTYQSQSWLKTWLSFLPEYAIGQVSRHRYRRLSIVCTTVSILLLLVLLTGTLILKRDSISAVLYLPSAIEDVKTDIRVGLTKSLEYSAQPQLMAQGLSRLDQLRSVQPVGPDVLLSSLSDVFEAHPHVQLNHLS